VIAEAPVPTALADNHVIDTNPPTSARSMSVKGVVAGLQVLLAARRSAQSDDHAYWYTVARGI
jgi:hypothetical protein